ncbi:MAG: hypothetical protein A2173_01770 [Planctomycetes bacterium RBG_13_44_8b]|nr:MAG: hypothetical protein A2173_01770 [Planctomycetes bacterium RBG_13_44_8b]
MYELIVYILCFIGIIYFIRRIIGFLRILLQLVFKTDEFKSRVAIDAQLEIRCRGFTAGDIEEINLFHT